jgi:hypothetical protein
VNKLLLLPTAKLVSPELRTEFGAIPTAMIPLDSRPAMQYIAEPYLSQGYRLALAVGDRADLIQEYADRHPEMHARLIHVGDSTSLGSTILSALDALPDLPDSLVINFADTFVADSLDGADVVCFREADEVYRWTTFQIDFGNRITALADKEADASYDHLLPVFVGVFAISDPARFREELRAEVSAASSKQPDPFYLALITYFNGLDPERRKLQRVSDWRDFGHLDTYYKTKRSFFLNRRFFNCVEIDDCRGIVRKSSTNAEKLLNEMKWYMELPKGLRYIAPRVFDYSITQAEPFMEMEYYSYPALNDVYLYGDLDLSVWVRVFQAIEAVLLQMHSHRFQPADPGQLKQSMRTMYETKTRSRLKPILNDAAFARFCGDTLRVNGETVMGLKQCLELLPDIADNLRLYDLDYFTVIHGDLCLSNILYDRRNSFIRVIDPRGEFGDVGIFGDMRYDLAKLSHSLEGDYDFIVNGVLESSWNQNEFVFKPQLDGRHTAIKNLFHKWLLKHFGEYYQQIKLIESLLFLSMVPLHADRFAAQEAFIARGLQTFTEVAKRSVSVPEKAIA